MSDSTDTKQASQTSQTADSAVLHRVRPFSQAMEEINSKMSGKQGIANKGLDDIYKFITDKSKEGICVDFFEIKQHLESIKIFLEDGRIKLFLNFLLYAAALPFITRHIYIDAMDIYRPIDIFAALDDPARTIELLNSYDEKSCTNIITRETDAPHYLNPENYIHYLQEKIQENQFIESYLLISSLNVIEFRSEFDKVPEAYSKKHNTPAQKKKSQLVKESIRKELPKIKNIFFHNNLALPKNEILRLTRARFLSKLLVQKIAPLYAKQTESIFKEINPENLEKNNNLDPKVIELAKIVRLEANKEEKIQKKQLAYIAHEIILTQGMVNSILENMAKRNTENKFLDKKKDILSWDKMGFFEQPLSKDIIEKLEKDEEIVQFKGLTSINPKKAFYVQYFFAKDKLELILKNEKIDYMVHKNKARLVALIKHLKDPNSFKIIYPEKLLAGIIELIIIENKSFLGKIMDPLVSIFRKKETYLADGWKEMQREYDLLLRKKMNIEKTQTQKTLGKNIKIEAQAVAKKEPDLKLSARDESELDIIKKILIDTFNKVEQKNLKEPEKAFPPTLEDFAELLKIRLNETEIRTDQRPPGNIKPKYLNYLDKYFLEINANNKKYLIPKSYSKSKLENLIRVYDFFGNYAQRKGNPDLAKELTNLMNEIEKITNPKK